MDSSSNPGIPASHPAPCLWPGKSIEDGPKPWYAAHTWETWRKFLAPGYGSVQHQLFGYLGSESSDERFSFLSLFLSVYLTLQ